MFKNVVLDLGGVVVHFEPRQWLVDRFFDSKTEQRVYALTFGSEEWLAWDRGEVGGNTVYKLILEKAQAEGIAFEVKSTMDDWDSMLRDKTYTINIMKQLKKQGVHLYYLSNTEKETVRTLQRREYWPLWDGGVASCNEGICKPDRRLYEILLDKYGLDPGETLFIDDHLSNLAPAEELGMTVMHYRASRQLVQELRAHGFIIRTRSFIRRKG